MRWPFRSRRDSSGDRNTGQGATDAEVVDEIARRYLSPDDLERWRALLRPAIQLVPARSGDVAVARLGGVPMLPTDEAWPTWEGHGPLSYIGEIMCDVVAASFQLDVELPSSGRLLFFYFDGSYDGGVSTVGTWAPETLRGARVVHVSGDAPAIPRTQPEGVQAYPQRSFAGRAVVTVPSLEHPALRAAFTAPGADDQSFWDHPVADDDLIEELYERHLGVNHQIGGYADPIQGLIEEEVASAALSGTGHRDDSRHAAEALCWDLVLQVETDDDLEMMWGDAGSLYWLRRRGDQEPGDFSFTWQCY